VEQLPPRRAEAIKLVEAVNLADVEHGRRRKAQGIGGQDKHRSNNPHGASDKAAKWREEVFGKVPPRDYAGCGVSDFDCETLLLGMSLWVCASSAKAELTGWRAEKGRS
jgi:hypothetical protein